MIGSLGQLDNDSTEAKQAVSLREPKLALPVETDSLALFLQLGPLKRSTFPKAAGHGSEDCILGALKKDSSARPYDSGNLAETWLRIRKVLEHPSARCTVKGVILEGQFRQRGSHIVNSVIRKSLSRSFQHLGGQVGGDNSRISVGMADKMREKLTGSGSDIKNILASLNRERAAFKKT